MKEVFGVEGNARGLVGAVPVLHGFKAHSWVVWHYIDFHSIQCVPEKPFNPQITSPLDLNFSTNKITVNRLPITFPTGTLGGLMKHHLGKFPGLLEMSIIIIPDIVMPVLC